MTMPHPQRQKLDGRRAAVGQGACRTATPRTTEGSELPSPGPHAFLDPRRSSSPTALQANFRRHPELRRLPGEARPVRIGCPRQSPPTPKLPVSPGPPRPCNVSTTGRERPSSALASGSDAHRGRVTNREAHKARCTCLLNAGKPRRISPQNPDKPRRTCLRQSGRLRGRGQWAIGRALS